MASRDAEVGGLRVRRALPQRSRRTVGPWCFVDHFGPTPPDDPHRMTVGPHPHTGLSTVTWLLEGHALHTDSLGSEQPLRPGQLNLMTAGRGISHAEETPIDRAGPMHGVQFWVAQPDSTRHGDPAFEHHPELPTFGLGPMSATLLLGSHEELTSPARTDWPTLGMELAVGPGTATLSLRPDFEHAFVVLDGRVQLGGTTTVEPGNLCYLEPGRQELAVEATAPGRALLLGGEPFEAVRMWWNFVARDHDELARAAQEWNDGDERFGTVASGLARIPAPDPPWRTAR